MGINCAISLVILNRLKKKSTQKARIIYCPKRQKKKGKFKKAQLNPVAIHLIRAIPQPHLKTQVRAQESNAEERNQKVKRLRIKSKENWKKKIL